MIATADILKSFLVTSSSFVVCKTATGTHLNECTCCAKAKRCRINLFLRHRFAIANFKYQLLVHCSSLLIVTSLLTSSTLIQLLRFSSQLLIVMTSLLMSSTLSAPAELSSSADCDDITADVIIADSRSCTSYLIHVRPPPLPLDHRRPPPQAPPPLAGDRTCSDQFFEVIPSVANPSSLLVQIDGGRLNPVVDLIGGSTAAYRQEPDFLVKSGWSQTPRRQQGRAASYHAPLLPVVGWFAAMRRVDSYHALMSWAQRVELLYICFWYCMLRRMDSYHALTCSVATNVCTSSRGVVLRALLPLAVELFLRALYFAAVKCSCEHCISSCCAVLLAPTDSLVFCMHCTMHYVSCFIC
ncbi:ABC transporter G family member 11-like [Dorcoceras hygrometricum]|uniref:ABC transporter G family member 11-like n=1 Tax=Dorcoceras hygrometricum TaxID=472368 RepID=A0A2Z7BC49_9LAMI|nr:ABC transporter G family member 11-like [Dorcoceras hygrometricum]